MGIEGPDFICIGLPKAATGWLYDQLQFHPDFWMPPIKELRYLKRRVSRFYGIEKRLSRLGHSTIEKKRNADRVMRKDLDQKRRSKERDLHFLRAVEKLHGERRDWASYKNIFSLKDDLLSGDITPAYCRLKDNMIAEIASQLPCTKILLLVREPISRTWSELSMANRNGNFDESVLEDADAFRAQLDTRRKSHIASRPTVVVDRWKAHFSPERFRYVLFDDIAANPAGTLREILLYIGADPAKQGDELAADYNRKSVSKKMEMSSTARAVLVDYFGDEIRACAEAFGGAARSWPAKYDL